MRGSWAGPDPNNQRLHQILQIYRPGLPSPRMSSQRDVSSMSLESRGLSSVCAGEQRGCLKTDIPRAEVGAFGTGGGLSFSKT